MNVITAENEPSPRCLEALSVILAGASGAKGQPAAALEHQLDSLLTALDLRRARLQLPRSRAGLPSEMTRSSTTDTDDVRLREVSLPLGVDGEFGRLVVEAVREGFPDRSERMLLEVAALKAANVLLMAIHDEDARQRAEDAARFKQDLLHQLVDNISAEVTLATPDGEIIFVNRTCIEHTGLPFGAHFAWDAGELLHPEDLPRVKAAWAHAVATGGTYEVEVRSRCHGVYRWMHSHGFPIKDSDGIILYWCTLHLDIDDRKAAEAALEASEQRLDLVVNTIPAMAWTADIDGNVDFFNQHFVEYVGMPVAALKHGGWMSAVHPDDLERLLATWRAVMATTRAGEAEARLRRFDGEYRSCLMRVSPLLDADGKVVKWYGANTDIEDWRRTEKALHTQDFLLNSVAETIAAPLVFLKPDGRIEVINQHLLGFFGKTRAEMEGWQANEVIHPEDRGATIAALRTAIQTGQPYEVEARRRRADGVYRWWRSNGYPMRDGEGSIIRWCVLYTDIDDRKRAEEALRASELMLRSMVDSIAAPLGFFKPTGELEVVNRMVLDYFGIPFGALADWNNIVHPDDIAASRRAWNRSLETGEPYVFEARIRYRDGTFRWNDHRGYPMRDAEGNIVRWCVLQLDVHDRRQVEARLAESERNLDQVISAIPGLVWSSDADGAATFLNQHYLDYTGRTAEEMLGWGFASVVHPDDIERLSVEWKQILRAEQPGELEARLRRHDGAYRWFLFRGSPVRDDAGKVTGWHGVNTDIEDRKRAEKAMLASEGALAASERRLQVIVDAIPALVWSALADGSADFVNQHYLDYVGMSMEEVRTWGWTKAVHPDDLPDFITRWQVILASGRAGENQARLRRHDGAYRWFLFRGSPVVDENGAVRWYGLNIDIEESKRAEEAVRESERNLRLQTETIPEMLWSARPDGSFDYCNARFMNFTGSARDSVMGDGWKDALHPDDRERTQRAWRHSVATGEPYEVEVRKFCAAAGEYHWCLTTALPLRDEDGRIIKWHGASLDIHDRKMTELGLRQMTETIPQMLWSATPEGDIDYCNQRLLEYSGLTAATVMDGGWNNLLHPDDREAAAKTWQRCVATGAPYTVEVRQFHAADQAYRWILNMAVPLRDGEDRIVKWYGSCVDIHDRKQAEQALAASERKLNLIINTMPAMAWSANPDGMCDFFNQNHLDYVGLPVEEMLGLGFVQTFHPDDLPQLMGPWADMLATGRGGEVEGRIRNRHGEYRRFLFRTNPLFDEDGNLIKWFGVNMDIEDRKRAEEAVREREDELRETQAELAHMTRVTTMGQLTASIAHELNQPLAGIMTNAGTGMRMLSAEPPNVAGARETVRRTLRDAGRASEVINRLRALFTKKSTTFEAVDLNLATQEVIALTSSELQRNNVSVRLDLAEDLPPVAGDRIQLQQVILNFIVNGTEAMSGVDDRPREMVIATRHDETGHIRLSVMDNGVGFDAASTEKLFNPFFTTKTSGMGIGLSVSRSIIESHQGRLWAEANRGHGATFAFALPFQPGQELADGGHRRHVETSIAAGMIGNA